MHFADYCTIQFGFKIITGVHVDVYLTCEVKRHVKTGMVIFCPKTLNMDEFHVHPDRMLCPNVPCPNAPPLLCIDCSFLHAFSPLIPRAPKSHHHHLSSPFFLSGAPILPIFHSFRSTGLNRSRLSVDSHLSLSCDQNSSRCNLCDFHPPFMSVCKRNE